jgi:hypothetical protein
MAAAYFRRLHQWERDTVRVPPSLLFVAALVAAGIAYVAGLAAGAFSLVGFEYRSQRQEGIGSTSWFPIRLGIPIWLAAGGAVEADFDVDARFGAVTFTVTPPLFLRTSLQSATAYVEGRSRGRVLFVAQTPGWYSFYSDPTPVGGPRCRGPDTTMLDIFKGSRDCPTYDVSYTVTWRIADPHRAPATARLAVPRPYEKLVTTRIRGEREIGRF